MMAIPYRTRGELHDWTAPQPEPVRDIDGPSRGFIVLCAICLAAFIAGVLVALA